MECAKDTIVQYLFRGKSHDERRAELSDFRSCNKKLYFDFGMTYVGTKIVRYPCFGRNPLYLAMTASALIVPPLPLSSSLFPSPPAAVTSRCHLYHCPPFFSPVGCCFKGQTRWLLPTMALMSSRLLRCCCRHCS